MAGTGAPPKVSVPPASTPNLVTICAGFPELPVFSCVVALADLSVYRAGGWWVTHVRVQEDR